MTAPEDPYEVPIVPGPSYEPTAPMPPAPAPPPPVYQQPPTPVYYQHPPQAPTWNPGRAAGNTVVVLVVLFFALCVLPVVCFFGLGALGTLAK